MGFFRRPPNSTAAAAAGGDDAYERKKQREAKRQREKSAKAREIGPLPAVADPERRKKALASFQFFLEAYFAPRFPLAWSEDHKAYIRDTQAVVVKGGLQAVAMPRGTGKTTIAECAVIWAVFRGSRDMVGLIGSTEVAAKEMLQSIKTELESNELLGADFPEVCYPIRQLDGINQRRLLLDNEQVRITFTKTMIILPSLPENPAASAIIRVAGLTGRVRGMKFTRPGGRVVRPQLVVIDDPQTDRSAKSKDQTQKRVALLTGAVLGLAGPGQKLSAIMPCTVIVEGDLADQFLNRETHPEWAGRRTKLLPSMPDDLDLWVKYGKVRDDGLRAEDAGEAGNAFYRKHRKAMDKGAKASWPARFDPDELSAIQFGMNLWLSNRKAFFAEYQNDPKGAEEADGEVLSVEQICVKLNNIVRGTIPHEVEFLTGFIDVHKAVLYWFLGGWGESFCGGTVDYGTYPDQGREHFALADCRETLERRYPKVGFEAALYSGLLDLVDQLATKDWPMFDGGTGRIDRILIDANWGKSRDIVYQVCRQSPHAAILLPSHGRGILASSPPMSTWKKKHPADRHGQNWVMARGEGNGIRHVTTDVNFWKSFVHARLATAIGDRGSFALCGNDKKAHQLLAQHFTAEDRVPVTNKATGRTVDEWKQRPERPDNHWFDGLVGSAIGASIEGLTMPEWIPATKTRKKVGIPDQVRAA